MESLLVIFELYPEYIKMLRYSGFGWDRVNFIPSSWYGAVFLICNGNILLITHWCFRCCRAILTQDFSTSHTRTQLGQVTQADQRDIPWHMRLCSAIKDGGKKEELEGHLVWLSLSSQVTTTEPCFPGNLWASACWWEVK